MTHPAHQYALDVVAGAVLSNRFVRQACERHLRDLADGPARGLYFDAAAAQHNLPVHPRKASGAITIGCIYCGGGAQFTNSGFRILRLTAPDLWRRFVVDYAGGEIILAVKYDKPLPMVRSAIQKCGGLSHLFDSRPWLFDYLELPPRAGYNK